MNEEIESKLDVIVHLLAELTDRKPNIYEMIGLEGYTVHKIATTEIEKNSVVVGGSMWDAKNIDEEDIPSLTKVIVVGARGSTLLVEYADIRFQSESQDSTNSYANILKRDIRDVKKLTVYLIETGGSNDILFKIQGSMDDSNWEDLKAETTLAASGTAYETLTDNWLHIRIQIKAASAGSQGTVTCVLLGEKM